MLKCTIVGRIPVFYSISKFFVRYLYERYNQHCLNNVHSRHFDPFILILINKEEILSERINITWIYVADKFEIIQWNLLCTSFHCKFLLGIVLLHQNKLKKCSPINNRYTQFSIKANARQHPRIAQMICTVVVKTHSETTELVNLYLVICIYDL